MIKTSIMDLHIKAEDNMQPDVQLAQAQAQAQAQEVIKMLPSHKTPFNVTIFEVHTAIKTKPIHFVMKTLAAFTKSLHFKDDIHPYQLVNYVAANGSKDLLIRFLNFFRVKIISLSKNCPDGKTPLMVACISGRLDIVSCILNDMLSYSECLMHLYQRDFYLRNVMHYIVQCKDEDKGVAIFAYINQIICNGMDKEQSSNMLQLLLKQKCICNGNSSIKITDLMNDLSEESTMITQDQSTAFAGSKKQKIFSDDGSSSNKMTTIKTGLGINRLASDFTLMYLQNPAKTIADKMTRYKDRDHSVWHELVQASCDHKVFQCELWAPRNTIYKYLTKEWHRVLGGEDTPHCFVARILHSVNICSLPWTWNPLHLGALNGKEKIILEMMDALDKPYLLVSDRDVFHFSAYDYCVMYNLETAVKRYAPSLSSLHSISTCMLVARYLGQNKDTLCMLKDTMTVFVDSRIMNIPEKLNASE